MSLGRPYGRYVLEERIAMGGMAEIFRARTTTTGFEKRVCIKRILPQFLEDSEFVDMFRDEAAVMARLQHANIVHVFDFGEVDDTLYLAMEFIDGADLAKLLATSRRRSQRVGVGEAVLIAIDVARGLHHAHTLRDIDRTGKNDRNGKPLELVHRDISPHNILISRAGEVKVTDFGIAKVAARASRTSTGVIKGKIHYMAPEQVEGQELDHRADQYSAGVVLWEMLAGERLFQGDNEMQILRRIARGDGVVAPSTKQASIPQVLDEIVLRMLAHRPADRFESMRGVEMALQRALFSGAIDMASADVRALVDRLLENSLNVRATHVIDAPPAAVTAVPSPSVMSGLPTQPQPADAVPAEASSLTLPPVTYAAAAAAPATASAVFTSSGKSRFVEPESESSAPVPEPSSVSFAAEGPSKPVVALATEGKASPLATEKEAELSSTTASLDSVQAPLSNDVRPAEGTHAETLTSSPGEPEVATKKTAALQLRADDDVRDLLPPRRMSAVAATLGIVVLGMVGLTLWATRTPAPVDATGDTPVHPDRSRDDRPQEVPPAPVESPTLPPAVVQPASTQPAALQPATFLPARERALVPATDAGLEVAPDAAPAHRSKANQNRRRGTSTQKAAGEQATLLVDGPGWWPDVYVDGRHFGQSPLLVTVPPGAHLIKVKKGDVEKSFPVTLKPGTNDPLQVKP